MDILGFISDTCADFCAWRRGCSLHWQLLKLRRKCFFHLQDRRVRHSKEKVTDIGKLFKYTCNTSPRLKIWFMPQVQRKFILCFKLIQEEMFKDAVAIDVQIYMSWDLTFFKMAQLWKFRSNIFLPSSGHNRQTLEGEKLQTYVHCNTLTRNKILCMSQVLRIVLHDQLTCAWTWR